LNRKWKHINNKENVGNQNKVEVSCAESWVVGVMVCMGVKLCL